MREAVLCDFPLIVGLDAEVQETAGDPAASPVELDVGERGDEDCGKKAVPHKVGVILQEIPDL